MNKQSLVLTALGFLILFGWATAYFLPADAEYAGLSCGKNRVVAFGWTHPDRARAELAAILAWKRESEVVGTPFGEWHNAQKRSINCRTVGGPNGQYQCSISALPCELAQKRKGV